MPTYQSPASPQDEARLRQRSAHAFGPENPLTEELVTFLQSGISILIGTVEPNGVPLPRLAHGCRVTDIGTVRVILCRRAAARTIEAIDAGQPVAATFSRPEDHRSIQLKARSARVVSVEQEDVKATARQSGHFADVLAEFIFAREFAEAYVGYWPELLGVIEFTPDQAFVQTPGPGAGAALSE
ncbi:hypothetical protein L0V05_10955 [Tabrizicola sp. J26]|uniref:hypothetical protein n=1 Tax=Alitabrizicola rongguiensis TaxID=2909234 RepID=UPI001F16B84E|nr:hypothetical protein [Tabrizicola rongguiensis]MCF1709337.1 hypothetical protein [Tabrizicola rongguiensis]